MQGVFRGLLGVFRVFFVKRVHVRRQRDDLAALRRRSPLGKPPGGLRFQRLTDDAEAANLLGRRDSNPGSHAPPALYKQLLLQPLERLADGQHTHSKIRRNGAPVDLSTKRPNSPENAIEDVLVGAFGEIAPLASYSRVRLRRHEPMIAIGATEGTMGGDKHILWRV